MGSHIGQVLKESGARAVALDNLAAYPFDYAEAFGSALHYDDIIEARVEDTEVVRCAVQSSDYVIHAAALADVAACSREPSASIHANIIGTQSVLSAVMEYRPRRLVFVSSASVYGNQPRHNSRCWSEDRNPVDPISVYGNVKTWGEFQVSASLRPAGLSYTSLRYFSVYGSPQVPKRGSHSWAVAAFAARALAGEALPLNNGGNQIRDFIHVTDVAAATVRALTAPKAHQQVINVGTGKPTTIREVAEFVTQNIPGSGVVQGRTLTEDPTGGYADTTKMQECLELSASVALSKGIEDYCRWFNQSQLRFEALNALQGEPQ